MRPLQSRLSAVISHCGVIAQISLRVMVSASQEMNLFNEHSHMYVCVPLHSHLGAREYPRFEFSKYIFFRKVKNNLAEGQIHKHILFRGQHSG